MLVFHGTLRDSTFPLLSKIFENILANLSDLVVWMIMILPLISIPPDIFPEYLGPFQVHQPHLTWPSFLYSTDVLVY